MPAEIVTGAFCADYFSDFRVIGSKGDEYIVSLSGTQIRCSCPAFKYSKDQSCKHITYVWEHACLWNEQWCDGKADDLDPIPGSCREPVIDGEECPACGGPVVPVRIAV